MATISYNTVTAQLEKIGETTTKDELIYDLLRLFGSVTETTIERIKGGKGNLAKDGVTILPKFGTPKRVVAYRAAMPETLALTLQELKSDPKIQKQAPRLLIVSDGDKVLAYDPKENEEYDNEVKLLHKDYDFFMPMAGIERFQNTEENDADVKASYIMARIYDDIRRYNDIESDEQIHALNIFLTRLLFCFFAEDTGIFAKDLFTQSINDYTLDDGSDLGEYIETAFDIMNIESPIVRDKMPTKISQFPYVNGGLFAQHFAIPHLSARTRKLILKCGGFNWAEINPDIFGSMIQAVIRPEDRAGLGLHYTSVPNIMKVIRPLFLDELWEAFNAARDSVKKLDELLLRLSKIKFFDPACGSGNFLIITYKELRRLEIVIWKQRISLTSFNIFPFSSIALTQFYGIELDEFAQETAILSLWLAEHQMNKRFSDHFHINVKALPLRASGHIVHGNACRLDWNTVCPHTAEEEVYIMGNPPYLGSSKLDKEQQSDRTDAIGEYANYKKIDYIGIWFIKGAKYIKDSISKCAFVSTNSICQGEMVEPLWSAVYSNDSIIDFAYTSFKWGNNAKYNAGVTCTVIGLVSAKVKSTHYIYTNDTKRVVGNITPYLTEGKNTIVAKHTVSLSGLPKIIMGAKPTDGGNLLLSKDEKDTLVISYPKSERWIKKLYSAADYIKGLERFCLWISDEDRKNAENIPFIKDRIDKTAECRLKSPDEGARNLANKPHQFREFNACDDNTLIIPSTSSENRKYIPMGYADNDTVVTNAMYMVCDAPLWLFGAITSELNMLWMKTIGGKLETRYRYTNLCYNSFPFPKITKDQKAELEALAEEVLLTREEYSELTLAQMYDPERMPQNLRDAHRALDLAVERCYRPEPFTSDEERLEHLFRLYEKMTKK